MKSNLGVLVLAIVAGCSGSGSSASSSDGSAPGDARASTDASSMSDDATSMAGPDGGTSGTAEASTADVGAIPYASSCGDGGAAPSTPSGSWVDVTGNLAGLPSECGNLSNLSSKPDEDLLVAGIAQKGLWGSRDGGGTWAAMGTGAGSASITNRTSSILYDPDHAETFWESGIYNMGGVYKTTDDGATLAQLGSVTHNDSVSVDFTDPARQTILAGTHEQSGHVFRSTNGGGTWTDLGANLPTDSGFTSQVLVIDAQTHLVGTYTYSNSGAGLGIYRTTNGGQTWTQVLTRPVEGHPLVMQDGTLYWSLAGNAGMVRSTDHGQTWAQTVGANVIVTSSPVELPDGRIASLGSQTVMVSSDCGSTWYGATTALPYAPTGLVYSPYQKAFYVWHFDCTGQSFPGDPVPSGAIMKFAFDYTTH